MSESSMPPLTAAQREIMEIVWSCGEVTVSDVRQALASKRKLARNTVQTMLVRLEEKGWLKHRRDGRSFVYAANRPRRVSLGAKVVHMVDRFFEGSAANMVTALIEYQGLSPDEAQRIRHMIEEAEAKRAKRGNA